MTMKPAESNLRERAELLRLLGHPVRLAIILRLVKGPRCVADIQELLDKPQANVSQHLMALRAQRVVDYYEDGRLRCYYIARPGLVKPLMSLLSDDHAVVRLSPEDVCRDAKRRRGETPTTVAPDRCRPREVPEGDSCSSSVMDGI